MRRISHRVRHIVARVVPPDTRACHVNGVAPGVDDEVIPEPVPIAPVDGMLGASVTFKPTGDITLV